ncbi:MAG: T9SS type A sorting domain-containing protein [Bacteroidota bacterium]
MKKLVAGLSVAALATIMIVVLSPALKKGKTISDSETSLEEAYEDDMDKAMAQEFEMTKDPALGYVPRERLVTAWQMSAQIRNTRSTLLQAQALNWAERGPNNVAGRVRAMFIDKRDATGNTIFAAGVGGGIWKCTGFKTSPVWSVVNDFLANLSVCALAQDPNTPNTMYAGTGEGWFNTDNIRGNGMYKSTDGGVTWNALVSTDVSVRKDFEFVNDIVVTSGGVVFAACRSATFCNNGGILRSTDGGSNWTRVIGSFPVGGTDCAMALNYRGADLEIAANGDLYATTGYNSTATANTGRIWKSTAASGGVAGSWTDITPVPATGTWGRIELACAPGDANNLVILIAGSDNAIKSIQRSTDGGTNWTVVNNPQWCDQGVTKADFTRGQAWYDLSAAIDPNSVNSFIIGGVDMMQTANSGSSFTQISQWASGCTGSLVHADIHNILYYPGSSSEIIAATDGGIFYSANGGATFVSKNAGLNITQYYAVALHPTAGSNYMLAGAQDNGTQKFQSAGVNTTTNVLSGDGAFCFIDQDNPNIQIGSFTSTSYRVSRDGGTSFPFNTSNGTGRFINPADYDNDMNILFHATGAGSLGFIKNIDAGTLTPVQTFIAELNSQQISAVKVDPNVPKRVWAAASGSGAPVLLKIDNDTALAPTVTTCTAPITTAGAFISSVDIEGGNSNHVLVTISNYGMGSVFESNDGGISWAPIEGNLPDMPIRWGIFLPDGLTFSVSNVSGIALATETGIWTTNLSNGTGTVWVPNNAGMANVSTHMLRYRPSDRTLAAATHGRGLYTSILGVATAINTIQNNKEFVSLVYPTLTASSVKFITGGATGIKQMTIQVTDLQGRQLQQNTLAFKNGQISLGAVPAGIYFVKFTSDNRKYIHLQKIVKQ